jgi:hypothetical protein
MDEERSENSSYMTYHITCMHDIGTDVTANHKRRDSHFEADNDAQDAISATWYEWLENL